MSKPTERSSLRGYPCEDIDDLSHYLIGFTTGIVTVLQIKATSPLTHNISGTAKAAVQSMLAFYIWKNPATALGVISIFVVLGGSLLYTIVKMNESKQASAAPKQTDKEQDVEMQKPLRAR